MNATEQARVRGYLFSVACSEAWVETIMSMLRRRDCCSRDPKDCDCSPRGRRVIKYAVDEHGRLRTKIPKLLEMIADAMVYPPPADDTPRGNLRTGVYHLGSTMRPCLCRECTLVDADGSPRRHVLWPAHYMAKEHLSYTCAVNRSDVDPDVVFAVDPQSELLPDVAGGRVLSGKEAAEQMRFDADAWRRDKLSKLDIQRAVAQRSAERAQLDAPDDENRATLVMGAWTDGQMMGLGVELALRRHRWSQVVGEVHVDGEGRDKRNTVRKQLRGLNNLGSLADFLELGHKLSDIAGVDAAAAAMIEQLLSDYSKTPRMRNVRIQWRQISK